MEQPNSINLDPEQAELLLLAAFKKDAHISINKNLIKAIGFMEAYLLSDLLSKYSYFKNKRMAEDGWFFNTGDNIKEDTGLSNFQQNRLIEKLEKKGIIQTKLKGIPAKKHFKICFQETLNQVSKKLRNLSLRNSETIYNKNNIIRINNKKDIFLQPKKIKNSSLYEKLSNWFLKERSSLTGGKDMHSIWDIDKSSPRGSVIPNSVDSLDKLVRLDKYNFQTEITPAIKWALNDDFWKINLRSLAGLRDKSKNGCTKFENIMASYLQNQPESKKPKALKKEKGYKNKIQRTPDEEFFYNEAKKNSYYGD